MAPLPVNKKLHNRILFCILWSVFFFSFLALLLAQKTPVTAATETRYLRGDTQTVNSLSAYQLGTSQSATNVSSTVSIANNNQTIYWGIRVWKRSSGGTETEITSGTPEAQVSRSTANPGAGLLSTTWSAPATSLATTDSIVVRVYMQIAAGGWTQGTTAPNFTSGQLGATQLDAATWTIYYYTEWSTSNKPKSTTGIFRWGSSTYDSRIEGFTYSSQTLTVGTSGTQVSSIYRGQPDNNIGGAFTFVYNSGSGNVTSLIISQTGTVSSANLSDLVLFYKQEATCSTSIPADATQFNSTPGVFSSGSSTVSGTMSVSTSQTCLYVRLDVGSGATAGQTIEIQISNPSTQVTASAGSVTPATAVTISGTTTIAEGALSLSIVDGSDNPVGSPSVNFNSQNFSFNTQVSSGTLGSATQKIKIMNNTPTVSWTLSLAATGGSSALWQSGGASYSHNGPASAGRLQVDPTGASITPGSGCSSTGISAGSPAYFANGSLDSINTITASASAQSFCYWYITAVGLNQDIPAAQPAGTYALSMTLTLL